MEKKTFYLVTIVGLLFVIVGTSAVAKFVMRSIFTTSRKAETTSSQSSVLTVLQAHNCVGEKDGIRFRQTGTLRYYPTFSTISQSRLERKLSLSADGLSE